MTATKTINKPAIHKDMKRAEELMRIHAQSIANKKATFDTIRNAMEAFDKNIKDTAAELIEIGERNKHKFDLDGNLMFEDGYLHIAQTTEVQTSRKFDMATFYQSKPDLIDVELKRGEIKKAFLDKEQRKELKNLGVDVDTVEVMQVKVNKK